MDPSRNEKSIFIAFCKPSAYHVDMLSFSEVHAEHTPERFLGGVLDRGAQRSLIEYLRKALIVRNTM
jgi:hypothetical protein